MLKGLGLVDDRNAEFIGARAVIPIMLPVRRKMNSQKIDMEIASIIEDINLHTSDIKVFANNLKEGDMNINYNSLIAFGNMGNKLRVKRLKLEDLKNRYGDN